MNMKSKPCLTSDDKDRKEVVDHVQWQESDL